MTATITDVATRAGVSIATVSRVLSGSDRVLPQTRDRVNQAMRDLDYRPSAVARSLRRRSTAVIGLVVTDITNPFYPEVVRGVEDEAQRQGRSVVLCNGAENGQREEAYLDVLLERRVDAVVVASGGLARRQAGRLAEFPTPVVLVNVVSPGENLPAVVSDNHQGGRLAGEHLLACGYERVIYVAGPSEAGETSERQEGVAEGVGDVDLRIVAGDGHLEGGAKAMRQTASDIRPPVGVAAHNDLSAVGALSVLSEVGFDVPGQVGVVGFDDIALSRYVTPALTTIAQDKYGMGVEAARTVGSLLNGDPVAGTITLPVELVVRDSTSPYR